MIQLSSRGYLYAPNTNVLPMCRNSRTIITVAPQRCMPRTSSPRKTSLVRWAAESYAREGSGFVVHGQEHARDGLGHEREHRGRAQRVEPVRALGHLAVEEAAQERADAGALVEPADDLGAALGRAVLELVGPAGLGAVGLLARRAVGRAGAVLGGRGVSLLMCSASPGRGTATGRRGGWTGHAGEKRSSSEFTEKRSPISTRPCAHAGVEAVERAHGRAAVDLALEVVDAAVARAHEPLRGLDVAHGAAQVGAAGGDGHVRLRLARRRRSGWACRASG